MNIKTIASLLFAALLLNCSTDENNAISEPKNNLPSIDLPTFRYS